MGSAERFGEEFIDPSRAEETLGGSLWGLVQVLGGFAAAQPGGLAAQGLRSLRLCHPAWWLRGAPLVCVLGPR